MRETLTGRTREKALMAKQSMSQWQERRNASSFSTREVIRFSRAYTFQGVLPGYQCHSLRRKTNWSPYGAEKPQGCQDER